MIALASSEGGPTRYVLQPGEEWLLTAAAWTGTLAPSTDEEAVPAILVRSPGGELVARISGATLTAPLYYPTIKFTALAVPTPPPPGSPSIDASLQKNVPPMTEPVFGSFEFYVRPADAPQMIHTQAYGAIWFSAVPHSATILQAPGLDADHWQLNAAGDLSEITGGWHSCVWRAVYDGTFSFLVVELDGVQVVSGWMGNPPEAYNFGLYNSGLAIPPGRTTDWIVWFRKVYMGSFFEGRDLLDFGASAADLSMFDPDTEWGTDGLQVEFDPVGPTA